MKVAHILFSLVILFAVKANAQVEDKLVDSIVDKMYWYALQNQSTKLFVHFDKNVYTNSENVWFTGYLLESNFRDEHNTLSVALLRNDDRSVLAYSKFVMEDGLAYGNLYIPDSLPTGDYTFICYTNLIKNDYPSALFTQPITIKSANVAGFIANLNLVDSIKAGMDTATVLLKAYTYDITLLKGTPVTYYIGDRRQPLKTGKIKTDNFGEAKISIPLKQLTPANNTLQVEINNGKEVKTFGIKLPVLKKETSVKFYPEGGHLVNGVVNTVGWEVMSSEGEPLTVIADLYQNDQLIQTLQSSAYGIGTFTIKPKENNHYYIKLRNVDQKDTIYSLPVTLSKAPAIHILNALALDTLNIRLQNNAVGDKWLVMVHDYSSIFVNATITSTNATTLIKIPLNDVPKGLNTFTLLDTLGRPWAERIFFAHIDKKAQVNISTDTTSYSTRQKVEMKFDIKDEAGKPLKSLVSIACVQDNRLDVKKMTDIESYKYLASEMSAFPFKRKVLGDDEDNKQYLENLLLVKGWRKYTWQNVATMEAADTVSQTSSFVFKGVTLMNDRPLRKPVQLNLKKFIAEKTSTLEFLKTDSAGRFQLTLANLLSEPNRQLRLSVNNNLKEFYVLEISDPYKEMNKKVASQVEMDNYYRKSFTQTSQSFVLKSGEGGKRLLDVKVVAKKDASLFAVRGVNACGDYVCLYGILNCPNHPFDGYQPVVGKMYQGRVYYGCSNLEPNAIQKWQLTMDGIYSKKEFYVTDLSKTDPSDPQFLSTLYWNHSLLTNSKGEGEATFYTSDIPGKFRIVIQGITNTNVVYGEQVFEVRK